RATGDFYGRSWGDYFAELLSILFASIAARIDRIIKRQIPISLRSRRTLRIEAFAFVRTQAQTTLIYYVMPENTFDIVSKIDLQEVSNAIQQALKEIHTRFDLKDSKSSIVLEGKDAIILQSVDEFKLKAVNDVFQQKLVKRGVPLKGVTYSAVE